ncbi:MAG: heavy metal translocating P-type ATPase metal-binding domain-containing protein, partial [Pseudomonadota bacterium]
MTENLRCFHCEEPVPRGLDLWLEVDDVKQPMCCRGCLAVADLIVRAEQTDYYRYREQPAPTAAYKPDAAVKWQAFDANLPAADAEGQVRDTLFLADIHCGACGWLIEHHLKQIDGVEKVQVDVQTSLCSLVWRPEKVAYSTLLSRLDQLGYTPHLGDNLAAAVNDRGRAEERELLKRLAVAGLGMMQVSTFAVSTYLGPNQGMDPAIARLMTLVSMLVAAPVVFYAGAPFLSGALNALRTRQATMDIPVALALVLAFAASTYHFFIRSGAVYFESATMFVFLLLCSRYVAMKVRHRATSARLALAPMLPQSVLRLDDSDDPTGRYVPRSTLEAGDLVRVPLGAAVPADGVLVAGHGQLDESLLTGESVGRCRGPGDAVLAGSVCISGSLVLRVRALGDQTRLSQMAGLMQQAFEQRPRRADLAQRLAATFTLSVVGLAALVYFLWWWVEPGKAFSAALAVLVVTCPCALSLAIPAALSAGATAAARRGVFLRKLEALTRLPATTCALVDKTGTLTQGKPVVSEVRCEPAHPNPVERGELLSLVAAVERHSTHPYANAFAALAPAAPIADVEEFPGQGLTATVAGRRLRVGSPEFVGAEHLSGRTIYVADEQGVLGWIDLDDALHPAAARVIAFLTARQVKTMVASGDRQGRVEAVAA